MWIIINHYCIRIPFSNNQYFMESKGRSGFFSWQIHDYPWVFVVSPRVFPLFENSPGISTHIVQRDSKVPIGQSLHCWILMTGTFRVFHLVTTMCLGWGSAFVQQNIKIQRPKWEIPYSAQPANLCLNFWGFPYLVGKMLSLSTFISWSEMAEWGNNDPCFGSKLKIEDKEVPGFSLHRG